MSRVTAGELLRIAEGSESKTLATALRVCAGELGDWVTLSELDAGLARTERVLAVLERARPSLDEHARRLVTAILTLNHLELDAYLDEHRVLASTAEGIPLEPVPLDRDWRLELREGGFISNEAVSVRLFQHFGQIFSWERLLSMHADQGRSIEEMLSYERAQLTAVNNRPPFPRQEAERRMLERNVAVFTWLSEHCTVRR